MSFLDSRAARRPDCFDRGVADGTGSTGRLPRFLRIFSVSRSSSALLYSRSKQDSYAALSQRLQAREKEIAELHLKVQQNQDRYKGVNKKLMLLEMEMGSRDLSDHTNSPQRHASTQTETHADALKAGTISSIKEVVSTDRVRSLPIPIRCSPKRDDFSKPSAVAEPKTALWNKVGVESGTQHDSPKSVPFYTDSSSTDVSVEVSEEHENVIDVLEHTLKQLELTYTKMEMLASLEETPEKCQDGTPSKRVLRFREDQVQSSLSEVLPDIKNLMFKLHCLERKETANHSARQLLNHITDPKPILQTSETIDYNSLCSKPSRFVCSPSKVML